MHPGVTSTSGFMNTIGNNSMSGVSLSHRTTQSKFKQSTMSMNRNQQVQYECIKTDLIEEYDKKVSMLNKRIEKNHQL